MIATLGRYSELIVKQVGDSVGLMGLRPQFVSRVSDILRLVDRAPQVVHAMLAIAGTAGAVTGAASPSVQVCLFGLAAVLSGAKHMRPYERIPGAISPATGVNLHGEISISRS